MLSVIEERDLLAQAFRDVCDELGCEYDNEEALIAAHDLKERTEAAEAREAELRSALEKIADEQKVYRGYGDYTIEPAYSAEEAQGMARQALAAAPAASNRIAELERVYIVFDGPPWPEAGRFVEVETADGRSVRAAEWSEYGQLWRLGPFRIDAALKE